MIDSAAPRGPESDSRRIRSARRAKHVLIVEDDPTTLRVLSDCLTAQGYRTSVATNGPVGIAMFEASHPDLVVLDVLLPRKNGFEVCFALRRSDHGKRTPIMLMSAAYQDEARAEQMRAALGADDFLLKPFELDFFVERVRELLGI